MVLVESPISRSLELNNMNNSKMSCGIGSPKLSPRASSAFGGSPLSPRLRHFKLLHSPHQCHRAITTQSHAICEPVAHRVKATSPELHDAWVNVIGPKLHPVDIVVLSSVSKWGHSTAHNIMTHQGNIKWNGENLKDLTTLEQVSNHWSHLKMELDIWEDGVALKCLIDQAEIVQSDDASLSSTSTSAATVASSAASAAGAAALARAMMASQAQSKDVALEPAVAMAVTGPAIAAGVCRVAVLRLVWCPVSNFDFVDASKLEQFHRVGPKLGAEGRASLEICCWLAHGWRHSLCQTALKREMM